MTWTQKFLLMFEDYRAAQVKLLNQEDEARHYRTRYEEAQEKLDKRNDEFIKREQDWADRMSRLRFGPTATLTAEEVSAHVLAAGQRPMPENKTSPSIAEWQRNQAKKTEEEFTAMMNRISK